jgi:hypothetical protein
MGTTIVAIASVLSKTVTAVATATPTVTPTARHWGEIISKGWWVDNLGQIVGAALGAGLAYIFGIFLIKKQNDEAKRVEGEKLDEEREVEMGYFFEDTGKAREAIVFFIDQAIDICKNHKLKQCKMVVHSIDDFYKAYLLKRKYFSVERAKSLRELMECARSMAMEAGRYNNHVENATLGGDQLNQLQDSLLPKYQKLKEIYSRFQATIPDHVKNYYVGN